MPEYEKKTDKERVAEITDKLENGIKDLVNGDNFKKYLSTMSKFHNYSFNNTMLIAMQKPDASLVAGYNTWKNKFERNVNRGEKGIQIFAPSPYTIKKEQTKLDEETQLPVLDKDGKPVTEEVDVKIPSFKVVSVFDVSQTNGKELPTLGADELTGNVKDFEKFFAALKEVSPVPIGFEQIDSGAKGYFSRDEQRIAINEGMSEVQTIKTAVHEIAHSKLHDRDLKKSDVEQKPKDRNTEEVEAESIAFTVCTHFGIDTSDYSFGYVATWGSDKEVPELKSSLETIRATSNELINSITDIMQEKTRDKEQSKEQTAEKPNKSNIIGNTAYSAIEDKQYFRLKSETAEKVANYLDGNDIPYSGRINGDKTTLTIGKANVEDYKAAVAAVTGKEKVERKQEQKPIEQFTDMEKSNLRIESICNNNFAVLSDSERFGTDIVSFESADRKKCVDYISAHRPAQEWTPYIIADLKTWADNNVKRSPLERFSSIDEAIGRFQELRNQLHNDEIAKTQIDALPPARLTLGVEGSDGKSAVDIVHVRNNKIYLVDDFTRMSIMNTDRNFLGLLEKVNSKVPFERVNSYVMGDNGKYKPPEDIPFSEWKNDYFSKGTLEQTQTATEPKSKANIIGNTPYNDIAEKSFIRIPTEKALAVAKILDKEGVKFSGRNDGENTTLTLSKGDMNKCKAIAQQLDEKTVPEKTDHFAVPFVLHDYATAKKIGENAVTEWRNSVNENRTCSQFVQQAIKESSTYVQYGVHFESEQALNKVLENFPMNRVAALIAHEVIPNKDRLEAKNMIDGRYSSKVVDWAMKTVSQKNFCFKNFDYCSIADKSHPVLVNSFAEKLINRENELANDNKPTIEDKAINIPMPDDTVTVADRNSFGYTWDGMLPLSTDKALELFENDQSVYLLHEDNTESLAVSVEDIEQHRGMYGIETEEWSKFLDVKAHYKELADKEPEYEAQLFNETEKAVGIYQLNDNPDTRNLCFEPLSALTDKGITPDKEKYTLVYAFDVSDDKDKSEAQLLEDAFEKFNMERPADFKGHSLSVSDIVVVQDKGNISSHYCDTVGFTEIAFLEKDRVNLQMKQIEDTVEQNDNNFDGIINNTPSLDELEAKAKSGDVISLMDVAKAAKNEREKPETKHDRKPSIHDKLRLSKEKQQPPKEKDAPTKKGMEI